MTVLGIDFDTRNVHACLLDDDTNRATYLPIPIADKGGSFHAARNVHQAITTALLRAPAPGRDPLIDSVWLIGLEDAFHRSHRTKIAQARVQGAILAALPRHLCVVPLPAGEWKKTTVGRGDASKDDVREWGILQAQHDAVWHPAMRGWPQDAYDALAIAWAVRRLNAKAITAA